jgi:hypothetical protein
MRDAQEADMATLKNLQTEYATLKQKCEEAAKRQENDGAARARKCEVAISITAIKRKYRIS